MKRARYICFEGTEGVGKTTQTQKLVDLLRSQGYKVLQTKEPGTPLCPLTMQLRGIMLDNQYDKVLTRQARELISQAIRSIHAERVVNPGLKEYDFIVQDRGILSGLAYGAACENDPDFIDDMMSYIGVAPSVYDDVVYLRGNIRDGLAKALGAKKEFEAGDAMESRGLGFLDTANNNMRVMSRRFNTLTIDVDGKSIDQVFDEIVSRLDLKSGA